MKYFILERLGLIGVYVEKLNLEDSKATRFTDELKAAQSFSEKTLDSQFSDGIKRSIKQQQLKLVRVIPC